MTTNNSINNSGVPLTGTAPSLTAGLVTAITGQVAAGANVTVTGAGTAGSPYTVAASGGSGTVTTTGSPATGNLTKFSGGTSIVNGDLSGDITTAGTLAATLATVNSNVGSFTNANIIVNAKGLITAASNGTAAADNNSSYRVLNSAGGVYAAGTASTRVFPLDGSSIYVPTTIGSTFSCIYIDPADFPTVGSLATKLRIRGQISVNNTAPARTFTFGLYPITGPSGATGVITFTVGTVITGSDGATVASPSANSLNNLVGSDFAIPTAGYYAIGLVCSGAAAANSLLFITAQLEMRNT